MNGRDHILELLGGQDFVKATDAKTFDREEYLGFLVGHFPKHYCRIEIVPDIYGTYGVIMERFLNDYCEAEQEHKRTPAEKLRELVLTFLEKEARSM